MDSIIIKDLKLYACHGVNDFEKKDGQIFYIDLEVFTGLSKACVSDDVNDTVSYAKIIKSVSDEFTCQSDNLIERAASRVCDRLFNDFSAIRKIIIEVKKPDAPIKADFGFVAVRLERERK